MKYILSIDQGTTSTRSIIFDETGKQVSMAQIEHKQIYPEPSWVEHDPEEIRRNVINTMHDAVNSANISWAEIISIGITNQRETVVAWDKITGKVLYNAIVWQCRRTSPLVNKLKEAGYQDLFLKKTGLVLDAYFSGTKMKWMLDNANIDPDKVAFGTIDSWIIYFLTGEHRTDASNASRTLLYDINKNEWSEELCEILGVPISSLPEVTLNATDNFGYFKFEGYEIPIRGVLGDQQAALFGQTGFNKGDMKTTYGTGNFSLLNIGTKPVYSSNGLLTTVGWQIDGVTTYALEGSVFITGAALKWLRDGIDMIDDYSQLDEIAKSEKSSEGVYFVPAFVGLGAPHWDSTATGTIIGISGGSNKANLIHATYDAIAYQTQDLLELMSLESGVNVDAMAVDGGATNSDVLMQKQADISQIQIVRPNNIETTALGAALMAGYKIVWQTLDEMKQINPIVKSYLPKKDPKDIEIYSTNWKKAVEKSKNWYD